MSFYQKKANTSATHNLKDIDTAGRVVSMYVSAFNNIDRDGDVIVKGAFTKTVKEQGPQGIGEIWHLLFHKTDLPVATPFELSEDSYGLLARVKMPNTDRGNETLQLYLDGHYKHHSIGYRTITQARKSGYNELQQLQLHEHSTVLWAANPAATVVDVKAFMTQKEIQDELALTIKGLRNGKYSDETFALLEIKMRQLMQAAADMATTTPAATTQEPGTDEKEQQAIKTIQSLTDLFKK